MTCASKNLQGGCSCNFVRYQIFAKPFIVHCCHCHLCQRQAGSAFVINALVESKDVRLLQGKVNKVKVATPSGKGQTIARCPKCQVAVWSYYYKTGFQHLVRFVRVGTLDNPDALPPDVHIYTQSKQAWVLLPENTLAVDIFYDFEKTWSKKDCLRRDVLLMQSKQKTGITET